jgi:hypothetical protein
MQYGLVTYVMEAAQRLALAAAGRMGKAFAIIAPILAR